MVLLIDAGNTRLKWAWLTGSQLSEQQAAVHRGVKRGEWTTALFDPARKPSRILICNVYVLCRSQNASTDAGALRKPLAFFRSGLSG